MCSVAQELHLEIEEFIGGPDLVQVTVTYPVHVSVANLARRLRGASSRAIRQSHGIRGYIWANQYYAASVNSQ